MTVMVSAMPFWPSSIAAVPWTGFASSAPPKMISRMPWLLDTTVASMLPEKQEAAFLASVPAMQTLTWPSSPPQESYSGVRR